MAPIGFGLTAEYDGIVTQKTPDGDVEVPRFSGGVISLAGDKSFNTAEALESGDGVIVVDEGDTVLVTALDEYPALKRVPVPDGADVLDDFGRMGYDELLAVARRDGLSLVGRPRKEALRTALREHRARLATGDTDAQAAPDHRVAVEPDGELDTPGARGELARGDLVAPGDDVDRDPDLDEVDEVRDHPDAGPTGAGTPPPAPTTAE